MKACFTLLLALCALSSAYAQTEAGVKRYRPTERRSFSDYDEEVRYHDKRGTFATIRTFRKDSSLYAETTYKMLPVASSRPGSIQSTDPRRHGASKVWYPNGQLYLSCDYKDDVLNGPFFVFYNDGSIKRREYYRLGRSRKAQCFTPQGEPRPCDKFYQEPYFPGGKSAMNQYFESKASALRLSREYQRVTARLTINEIGQVVRVSVVAGDAATQALLSRILRDMPNWRPAILDGSPVLTQQTLPLMLTSGSIQVFGYEDRRQASERAKAASEKADTTSTLNLHY